MPRLGCDGVSLGCPPRREVRRSVRTKTGGSSVTSCEIRNGSSRAGQNFSSSDQCSSVADLLSQSPGEHARDNVGTSRRDELGPGTAIKASLASARVKAQSAKRESHAPRATSSSKARETLGEEVCGRCNGRGFQGLLGRHGFGLIRRRCRRCTSNHDSRVSTLTTPSIDAQREPEPEAEDSADCAEVPVAHDTRDNFTVPVAVGSATLDVYDRLCDPRTLGSVGVVAGVGVGLLAVLHPGAATYLARAFSAASTISATLSETDIRGNLLPDLRKYVEATTSNLEMVRNLTAAQTDRRLERPVQEIALLMEQLVELVSRFVSRRRLAKMIVLSDFNAQKDEMLITLGLWNNTLTQSLQTMQQDTLQTVVNEVRGLAKAISGDEQVKSLKQHMHSSSSVPKRQDPRGQRRAALSNPAVFKFPVGIAPAYRPGEGCNSQTKPAPLSGS